MDGTRGRKERDLLLELGGMLQEGVQRTPLVLYHSNEAMLVSPHALRFYPGKDSRRMLVVSHIEQLLGLLKDLHARGIVHRDVRADNFYLQVDGNILLNDFGCAHRVEDGETTYGGCPEPYIRVKRLAGEPYLPDPRDDL